LAGALIVQAGVGCAAKPEDSRRDDPPADTLDNREVGAKVVRVSGPTIIVFRPADLANDDEEGAAEARFHVEAAVAGAVECLKAGGKEVRVEAVDGEDVLIDVEGKRTKMRLEEGSVGVGLADKGRKPCLVSAFPSLLIPLLSAASAAYFDASSCRQEDMSYDCEKEQ